MNEWQHIANVLRDRSDEAKTALQEKQSADHMVNLSIQVNSAYNTLKKANGKETHDNVAKEFRSSLAAASRLPKEKDRIAAYHFILNRAYRHFFNAKAGIYVEAREQFKRQALR